MHEGIAPGATNGDLGPWELLDKRTQERKPLYGYYAHTTRVLIVSLAPTGHVPSELRPNVEDRCTVKAVTGEEAVIEFPNWQLNKDGVHIYVWVPRSRVDIITLERV